ncbi:probable serine/threonine-protein kinase DDB_G0282963 [Oppia nitens]|uniref:probable serine/threonine-protein kinase DDB_G0282963 n=1 Tax=Oppia nitens TaxID=1686743 RepID=UPI0023DCC5D2|nr:probable serine/threonine-protein kinase DDB_G0282963 [Oppia nitens]
MSCSQVMYQPYSSYFPYPQRPSPASGHHHHHHHHQSPTTASIFGATSFTPMDTTGSRSALAFSDNSSLSSTSSLMTANNHTVAISSTGSSRKLLDPSSPPLTLQPLQSSTSNSRKNMETSPKESIPNTRASSSSSSSAGGSGGGGSGPQLSTQSGANNNNNNNSLRDNASDAQYLSANCVVYTYFSGDTSSVVDQHFNRALNQQTYNSANDKQTKDIPVPMSQRSFPPSFWNVNHQPVLSANHHSSHTTSSSSVSSALCLPTPSTSSSAPMHELYADAYHHSGALHAASIHHQNDPWHYTLSATAANPYSAHHHHRAAASIHDLSSYSSAASNRFNAQYSSLLLQPASMRSTRLTPVSATCSGFDKSTNDTMSWPTTSRYHESAMNFAAHPSIDPSNYSASAAYGAAMSAAMSGLDTTVQDSSKDLYWF